MYFSKLAIPMRAQPFHYGHMHLLREMSKCADVGVVVLCRDYDKYNNPFTFDMRSKWIRNFLEHEDIRNLTIVNRVSKKGISRLKEYSTFFDDCDISEITILTTNETNDIYRSDGFVTFNHHEESVMDGLWKNVSISDLIKIEGTGTIIRDRISRGLSLDQYLSEDVLYDVFMTSS